MSCILPVVPFPSSVAVLGECLDCFRFPGLSRFRSVFADLFVEVSLPTRLLQPVWFRFRRSESVLSSAIVLLSANILPRMSCYLVCKLDIKICSVFGFQGTGVDCFTSHQKPESLRYMRSSFLSSCL